MLRATLNECEKKWFKLSATSSKNCAGICVSWSRVCTVSAAAAAVFVCVRAEYGCAFYWHYCLLLHFLSFTMIAVWSSRLWPFSWFVAHLKWFRHKHKHNVPCALGKLSLVVCVCVSIWWCACVFLRSKSSMRSLLQAQHQLGKQNTRMKTHRIALKRTDPHRCGRDMKSRAQPSNTHTMWQFLPMCLWVCVCVPVCWHRIN